MKELRSSLRALDMLVYRYDRPNGDFIQDVMYGNNTPLSEVLQYIKMKHGDEPTDVEIAR